MSNSKEWWYVDAKGRRIGWLWPEDMVAILEGFYGPRQGVLSFCRDFGFVRSTVDRWVHGKIPIPKNVAQLVNMLGTMKVHDIALAPIDAEWLEEGYEERFKEAS